MSGSLSRMLARPAGTLLFAVHLALAAGGAAAAAPFKMPADSTALRGFVDSVVAGQMLHIPGMVVVLVRDSTILLARGYGYADLERRIPFSPDSTVIRIASVSKLITATAVLQLAERGTVDLHRDVDATLVASTESWETALAITPAQALNAERRRRRRLLLQADPAAQDGVGGELVLAADQFIIEPAGRVEEAARAHAFGDDVRTVIAGDTLDRLCHRIYGDPRYYLQVAEANKLGNFRKLVPGTTLVFPPLDGKGNQP